MRIFEGVAQAIVQEGVDTVFGVRGDGNMALLATLVSEHGVRFHNSRHEQGATAMADGYARASRKVGIVSVTHGPALVNTGTSLAVARAHRTPLIVLAADTPLGDPLHIQALDQLGFGRQVAGASLSLSSPESVAADLRRAFEHARAGRGPIVVNIPTDVDTLEIDVADWAYERSSPPPAPPVPAEAALQRAAELLAAAAAPAIIAGRGAVDARAEEALTPLAERLGAPVFTTLQAAGFAGAHRLHAANAGSAGKPAKQELLSGADCILAAGASLNRYTTANGKLTAGARVISVDTRPGAAHQAVDLELTGDAGVVAARLGELVPVAAGRAGAVAERIAAVRLEFEPEHGDGTVDPRTALIAIDAALPRERTVVLDAGHFITFAAALVGVRDAADWFLPIDNGTIGQSVGVGLGVAVARGTRVNVIAGDGGFLMGAAELETAGRLGLPVTYFVLNDDAYGIEGFILRSRGYGDELSLLPTPDLAAMARAVGAAGLRIDAPEQLAQLRPFLESLTGPAVVDVRINRLVASWSVQDLLASTRKGALAGPQ
jgi:thiamine pyrophosphate-dependent acetolactate synthase large subunit-like protein